MTQNKGQRFSEVFVFQDSQSGLASPGGSGGLKGPGDPVGSNSGSPIPGGRVLSDFENT